MTYLWKRNADKRVQTFDIWQSNVPVNVQGEMSDCGNDCAINLFKPAAALCGTRACYFVFQGLVCFFLPPHSFHGSKEIIFPQCSLFSTDLVKHSESLADLLLTVGVFHFPGHHCQKLGKVNGSITWKKQGKNKRDVRTTRINYPGRRMQDKSRAVNTA